MRAVDPTSIGIAARWAADNHAPLHVHVSEQPAENRQCFEAHGRTPIAVIAGAGGLGPDTTLVHATHASKEDISLVGEVGANCCLCPTTERDLADGIGPSEALAAAGARLCVGSDSHAIVDLFEETRAVELGQRVTKLERGVHSTETLALMATTNGYRSPGVEGGRRSHTGLAGRFHHHRSRLGAPRRHRPRPCARGGDLRCLERGCTSSGGRRKARCRRRDPCLDRCRIRARAP